MHNCPDCDQACHCDGEDHYNAMAEEECVHACQDYDEDDEEGEQEWDGLEDYYISLPHQEPRG